MHHHHSVRGASCEDAPHNIIPFHNVEMLGSTGTLVALLQPNVKISLFACNHLVFYMFMSIFVKQLHANIDHLHLTSTLALF